MRVTCLYSAAGVSDRRGAPQMPNAYRRNAIFVRVCFHVVRGTPRLGDRDALSCFLEPQFWYATVIVLLQ